MENNNQVEKFDPSKLMDGVRDRIKATFVSLIPDDQWTTMCDTEMKKFFQGKYKKDYNGRDTNERIPSEFEEIVIQLMREKCRDYLKELLAKPEYSVNVVWENSSMGGANKTKLSNHLDTMIKEKMPEMMSAMFSSVMADAFYNFFGHIQNKLQQPQY